MVPGRKKVLLWPDLWLTVGSKSSFSSLRDEKETIEKYIRRARAVSGYPIRRFTVTKNMKIPEWESVNHELCGFNYRLPDDKTSYLRQQMPEVWIELFNSFRNFKQFLEIFRKFCKFLG